MSKSKLTIFKNEKVGQPIKKKDGSVLEYNGEPMLHCALNGKINLPEGLPAGDYEVAIYQYTSDKNPDKPPLKYYSGTIKPAWKKDEAKPVNAHNKAKGNGYVKEAEDLDDDLPF
jgi:hypothetical protein